MAKNAKDRAMRRWLWYASIFLSLPNLIQAGQQGQQADKIIVHKKAHELVLMREGKPLKTYHISIVRGADGKKIRQGDRKTPVAHYIIDSRKADSHFHRALHISYPNAEDLTQARKDGIDPGGDIMIHGLPTGLGWIGKTHLLKDWTAGCIAVTNDEIDEIWDKVPDGTPIDIEP